jgi:hypothetical protein
MDTGNICFETLKKFAARGFPTEPVPERSLNQLRKAASHWQDGGDQFLAMIYVAQSGLRQSDIDAMSEVLLQDARASPSEKGKVFELSLSKAGHGRDAGDLCFEAIKKLAARGFPGEAVPAESLSLFRKVASHWQGGDQALAMIYVAQSDLRRSDVKAISELLLQDARASPSEKGTVFELSLAKAGYNPGEPREGPGHGRESSWWTSDGGASAPVEGRSAADEEAHIHYVMGGRGRQTRLRAEPLHVIPKEPLHVIPKDEVIVRRPDNNAIVFDDPDKPRQALIAPPKANFQEIYAAGQKELVHNWYTDFTPAKRALEHGGTYDFQRDKATNTFIDAYIPAANYAVGVYMAGGGYGLHEMLAIAEGYSIWRGSKNRYDYYSEGRKWARRGWEDAQQGIWEKK